MRLRIVAALVFGAPAAWAGEKLGLEAEATAGPVWALTDICRYSSCPSPPAISVRVGYEFVPFASVGVRVAGILGPEGIGRACGTSNCDGFAGYRSASLMMDGCTR